MEFVAYVREVYNFKVLNKQYVTCFSFNLGYFSDYNLEPHLENNSGRD